MIPVQLVAYIVHYNDAVKLAENADALREFDEVVMVDGAWEGYPYGKGESDDHTSEVISDIMDHTPVLSVAGTHPWLSQCEKRTFAHKLAAARAGPDGWVFWLDADEQYRLAGENTLREDLERVPADAPSAHIRIEFHDHNGVKRNTMRGRLTRADTRLTYVYNHYTIFDSLGRNIYTGPEVWCILGGHYIKHDTTPRPDKRQIGKQDYYERRRQERLEQRAPQEYYWDREPSLQRAEGLGIQVI